MKKCFECGTEIPDDAIVCPKCGAPQPTPKSAPSPNFTAVPQTSQDVWNTPIFALLPFVAAVLFVLGALVLLITAIRFSYFTRDYFGLSVFIFAGILIFLASIANLVSALPKFIKQISNK